MAKYQITFSCGHTEEIQLFGKNSSREDKITYFEKQGICSQCYKNQQNLITNQKSSELNLPELIGSEKQVTWANKIRLEKIENQQEKIKHTKLYIMGCYNMSDQELIALAKSKGATDEQIEKSLEKLRPIQEEYRKEITVLKNLKTETFAKWFIDNR